MDPYVLRLVSRGKTPQTSRLEHIPKLWLRAPVRVELACSGPDDTAAALAAVQNYSLAIHSIDADRKPVDSPLLWYQVVSPAGNTGATKGPHAVFEIGTAEIANITAAGDYWIAVHANTVDERIVRAAGYVTLLDDGFPSTPPSPTPPETVWLTQAAGDARYVNGTGDIMTGTLTLPAAGFRHAASGFDAVVIAAALTNDRELLAPDEDGTLATREWTQAAGDARYVNVTGDTMTGGLIVPFLRLIDSETDYQADLYTSVFSADRTLLFPNEDGTLATREWALANISGGPGGDATNITITPSSTTVTVNSSTGSPGTISGATNALAGIMTAAHVISLDGKVNKAGDTMTGLLTLPDIAVTNSATFGPASAHNEISTAATAVRENKFPDANGVLAVTGSQEGIPDRLGTRAKCAVTGGVTKGQVVYVISSDGTNPTFALANASSEATSSKTYGFIDRTCDNNGFGTVITNGILEGLSIAAPNATAGSAVWLATTNGGIVVGSPPAKPAHSVYLGVATKISNSGNPGATVQTIEVKVQNGYELGELHDASSTPATSNQALIWNSTTGLWTPTTLTISLVDELQTALNGKAASSHSHAISDITNLQDSLDSKAPSFSPEIANQLTLLDVAPLVWSSLGPVYGVMAPASLNGNRTWTLPDVSGTFVLQANTTNGMSVGTVAGSPTTLANGQIWYDSTAGKFKFRQGGATAELGTSGPGASVTVSDTPPGTPAAGDLWWNSADGNLYLWYQDGTSNQWVSAAYIPTGGGAGGGGTGTVTSVSVVSANGISGSVANASTTPEITLTLNAITPTSVNGITLTNGGSGALTVTGTTSVSGTNTGDQTIILSGAVTGNGTGAITTTLSDNTVTETKIANNAVTANKIAAGAVTYAKIQSVIGYGILANPAATSAAPSEVTIANDQILGRSGSGNIAGISCTAAGRALIDDASAGEQVRTLTTISGRTDTNASFSLSDSDNGTVIVTTATSPINVTVPSSLSANFSCLIVQGDTGQLTFVVSGTTINSYNSLTKTAGRYAAASLVSVAANTFILSGQLA